MPTRRSPPSAHHALTASEKRNPKGWVHPDVRRKIADIARPKPVDPDAQCFWCLRFFGSGCEPLGTLWNGHRICGTCAVDADRRRG